MVQANDCHQQADTICKYRALDEPSRQPLPTAYYTLFSRRQVTLRSGLRQAHPLCAFPIALPSMMTASWKGITWHFAVRERYCVSLLLLSCTYRGALQYQARAGAVLPTP